MIQLQPELRLNHAKPHSSSVMQQCNSHCPKLKDKLLATRCANSGAIPGNLTILSQPLFRSATNTEVVIPPAHVPEYSRIYGIFVACDSVDREYSAGRISDAERDKIFNQQKHELRQITNDLGISRRDLENFARVSCSAIQCLDEILD